MWHGLSVERDVFLGERGPVAPAPLDECQAFVVTFDTENGADDVDIDVIFGVIGDVELDCGGVPVCPVDDVDSDSDSDSDSD